jgi:SWI/SNF-related matrix-associated actin-dependent regulator 1 of chromatin subfamily A
MISIVDKQSTYEVTFPYKPNLVEEIKAIPGRRFVFERKCWSVPASSKEALLKWAYRYTSNPFNIQKPEIQFESEEMPELEIEVPLKRNLFPYQRKGVAYGLQKKRFIIADEPGLGKTAQAIALSVAAKAKCVLVICPATLKENWRREFIAWSDRKPMILHDKVKKSFPQYYHVGMVDTFITNYESLKKYFVDEIVQPIDTDTGKKKPLRLNHIRFSEKINLFDFVIIDEAHRCKDGRGQQTKFVMGIAKDKEWVLNLTGTPVVNKPTDLISQLYIINQLNSVFGGYRRFVDRYCAGPNGSSNLRELNVLLKRSCFYRREKKDVLKDLPDKMRQIVKCDIATRNEYDKALADLETYMRENLKKTEGEIDTSMRGEVMVRMGILKQISARGKIDSVAEFIEEIVDADEKIVVFVHHKEIAKALLERFPESLLITGENVGENRQRAIDEFQNNPRRHVIICSIKAAGVGITLTASSRVAFVELPWHPADCDQCEDRCHRIGQKDSVQCTYFLGDETIDEDIYEIIQKKREMANAVTGTEDTVEVSMIDELISLFRKR